MSRYICKDKLTYSRTKDGDVVIYPEAIAKAPSIDIVRCRECKYWQPHEQYGFDEDRGEYHDYCGLLVPDDDWYAFMRTANDFCSYGVKKGADDE